MSTTNSHIYGGLLNDVFLMMYSQCRARIDCGGGGGGVGIYRLSKHEYVFTPFEFFCTSIRLIVTASEVKYWSKHSSDYR